MSTPLDGASALDKGARSAEALQDLVLIRLNCCLFFIDPEVRSATVMGLSVEPQLFLDCCTQCIKLKKKNLRK